MLSIRFIRRWGVPAYGGGCRAHRVALKIANWLRFAQSAWRGRGRRGERGPPGAAGQIGFVLRIWSLLPCAAPQIPRLAQAWLCFARLPQGPPAPRPCRPGVARNWLRFAQSNVPRSPTGRKLGSFCAFAVSDTRAAGRIAFVSHNWVFPRARLAGNWVRFAHFALRGPQPTGEIGFVLLDSSPCHRSVPNPQSEIRNQGIGFVLRICPLETGSGSPKLGLFRTVRPSVASHYCDKKHKKNRASTEPKSSSAERNAIPAQSLPSTRSRAGKRKKRKKGQAEMARVLYLFLRRLLSGGQHAAPVVIPRAATAAGDRAFIIDASRCLYVTQKSKF